jgi:hypothetical protein
MLVTVPLPLPVAVRVVPEKESPAPSVIADGAAEDPVGLPTRVCVAMLDKSPTATA